MERRNYRPIEIPKVDNLINKYLVTPNTNADMNESTSCWHFLCVKFISRFHLTICKTLSATPMHFVHLTPNGFLLANTRTYS